MMAFFMAILFVKLSIYSRILYRQIVVNILTQPYSKFPIYSKRTLIMKKVIPLIVTILLVYSCGCKDEIVESFRLSEFEKTLIPYTSHEEISYIDDEGAIFIANSQPKESIIDTRRAGPDSCMLTEYEEETNLLNFQSKDILIELRLTASNSRRFSITTRSDNSNNNGRFDLACTGLFDVSIEERLTDVSINQFDFQNVFVFQNCSETSGIERIIYSNSNGIEYIEFTDGKWLKLNQ